MRPLTPRTLFPRRPWRVYGDSPRGSGPGPQLDAAVVELLSRSRPVHLTPAEAAALAARDAARAAHPAGGSSGA